MLGFVLIVILLIVTVMEDSKMMFPALLLVFALPAVAIPFVYFTAKKSAKLAAVFVALIALVNIALVATTIPTVLNSVANRYVECYSWIPTLNSASFTLFTDGISASIAIVSLILIAVAAYSR